MYSDFIQNVLINGLNKNLIQFVDGSVDHVAKDFIFNAGNFQSFQVDLNFLSVDGDFQGIVLNVSRNGSITEHVLENES